MTVTSLRQILSLYIIIGPVCLFPVQGIDNMNVEHEKWCDVNVISSLLKTFFRKLPDSLITSGKTCPSYLLLHNIMSYIICCPAL